MPTALHQALAVLLWNMFDRWLENDSDGRVTTAPFKIYLTDRLYREPDVAVMLGKNAHRRGDDRWKGADLVVEVISESNRQHDVVTKLADYAAASIPEYWIVDPAAKMIAIHVLSEGRYQPTESAVTAVSRVLPGLTVDVADLFAAAAKKA